MRCKILEPFAPHRRPAIVTSVLRKTINTKSAPLRILTILAAASLTAQARIDVSKLPAPAKQKDVTYAKDIKPLLEASCIRCHGADRPKAGLRLDSLEGILKGSKKARWS